MKPDAQFPETRGQQEIKLRGLDRQELAPIVAETGADSDHGRNEMLGEENYSPNTQNELAYQLTKSSYCHCQVGRTTLARAKQSTDQRMRCDTERAGKKSSEKINKINLDCGGRYAQRTHHQVVQSMTHTPTTVNNPKQ